MELATFQRKMRGLIKSDYLVSEADEPYVRSIAGSEQLEVLQEIVFWWRALGLTRYCVLTTGLLGQRGLLESTILRFIREQRISPFIDQLGPSFLEWLSREGDSVVASVAQFELALIRAKLGDLNQFIVEWEYDPSVILNNLIHGLPLAQDLPRGAFQTIVSRDLPDLFVIVAQDSELNCSAS